MEQNNFLRPMYIIKQQGSINLRRISCFCISFLLILGISDFLPVRGEEQIFTNVIRLHILANSDSEYDQNLKLSIRDILIKDASSYFDETAVNTKEAAENIKSNAENLCEMINNYLSDAGVSYKASIKLGKEKYPTREYDGITYPAGEYMSLRIILGEGRGENWWCVLFPPLCTEAAMAKESLEINSDAKKTFVTKGRKYIVRLKILELFKKKGG